MQYIEYDKEEDALPNYIRHRLEDMRQGFVMCITGSPFTKTGNGKTTSAARVAELLDEDFRKPPYTDKFTVLPSEFTARISDCGMKGRIEVLVLDEAEIGASSREWQDAKNKAIANALNTFRERRCLAIVIAPLFSDIDKRIRKLVSIWAYPELYAKRGGRNIGARLRVFRIRTDIFGEEIQLRKMTFFDKKNHRIVKASFFNISMPSKELKAAVEEKLTKFKNRVMEQAKETSLKAEIKLGLVDANSVDEMTGYVDAAMKNDLVVSTLKMNGKIDADTVSYILPKSKGKSRAIAKAINVKYEMIQGANELPTETTDDR